MFVFKKQSRLLHRQLRQIQEFRLAINRRQWIIHDDLSLFPYKVQITSWLNSRDLSIPLQFYQKLIEMAEEDNNFINCLFLSNEAHFDLNANVNEQNYRIWSESNPEIIHETELHPERVIVWCAVSSRCIVGPYFFEENENLKTN